MCDQLLPDTVLTLTTPCSSMCALQMYLPGKCPYKNQDTECLKGEPSAGSRMMFALDMDKGLFWMGVSWLP